MPNSSIWTTEFLEGMRQQADPLADEVLKQIIEVHGPKEARRIFDVLIRNVEMPLEKLPSEIEDFIATTQQLPPWTDWDQVALAHELFLDHGPKFLVILYYKSLPLLYCCKKGAEVLVRTSRLTNREETWEIFTRRIAETGQFLVDVMTPGALKTGGRGIQSIQKVRLIHAAIRHFVGRDGWNREELGLPINQEDMAITLMTFGIALIDGLEQLKIEVDPKNQAAFIHTWNAIGHVLGIDPAFIPDKPDDARLLLEKILQHQATRSEGGAILADALLKFAAKVFPGTFLDEAPAVLIREFIGRERAEMLNVYPGMGCLSNLFPFLLRFSFGLGERLEDKIEEPLQIFIDKLSRKSVALMVQYFDQFKQRHFSLPEVFQEAWLNENP